jgi:hypothetical protein
MAHYSLHLPLIEACHDRVQGFDFEHALWLGQKQNAHNNLDLLCGLELILGLPYLMPILEVVHILTKYAQCENVFIINFVDAINFVEA